MSENSRRQVLTGLAAGAAATAVPVRAAARELGDDRFSGEGRLAGPDEAWALVAPYDKGAHLGYGWFLGELAFERGAARLELLHESGRRTHAALCYHQGRPRGLAHSELLDLVLMDGGQGDKRTEEELGRVLLRLAEVVRENEAAVLADRGLSGKLLTHAERVDRYGPEVL